MNKSDVENLLLRLDVDASSFDFIVAYLNASDVPGDEFFSRSHQVLLTVMNEPIAQDKKHVKVIADIIIHLFLSPTWAAGRSDAKLMDPSLLFSYQQAFSSDSHIMPQESSESSNSDASGPTPLLSDSTRSVADCALLFMGKIFSNKIKMLIKKRSISEISAGDYNKKGSSIEKSIVEHPGKPKFETRISQRYTSIETGNNQRKAIFKTRVSQ